MNFDEEIKRKYGKIRIEKGIILYHMFNDTTNNNIFYFHPSEANIQRLNYIFEERYELIKDIELPLLFNITDNYKIRSNKKYILLFYKNNSIFQDGYISSNPTNQGLQMIINEPSTYLKKISEKQNIRYGWNIINNIYPIYTNISKIIFFINQNMKDNLEKYIQKMKNNNWSNSLILILYNNCIEYYETI